MPDFLLELLSEEIPARMQEKAVNDLKKMVIDGLSGAGLGCGMVETYATPRRIALFLSNVPCKAADGYEEFKGPRVGAQPEAINGFLKRAGILSLDQADILHGGKKGDFYIARVDRSGREAVSILAELIPEIIAQFPWPKSMRWGTGSLRWVRPLHSILCLFDPSESETVVVPFAIGGVESSDTTRGHRFMGGGRTVRIKRCREYAERLFREHVLVDSSKRKQTILEKAHALAHAQGLKLVDDESLLHEVTGLVEWPVVLSGAYDANFLNMPPEVVRTTIRNHQKCFVLCDGSGALVNRFLLVANIAAEDGGAEIIAGNERVIAARLADARFFYEQDLRVPLEKRLDQLHDVVFHEQLGSLYDRVERIVRCASELASKLGADPELVARAARLAKVDLVTEVVGEFPELQGVMGFRYALAQGELDCVARAIRDHYKPCGPTDPVPEDLEAVAVALADKLDMLSCFWSIGEIPTGSRDPYALRRAALGVVRILLECEISLPLLPLIGEDRALLSFLLERLRVYLRERGRRGDVLDAALSVGGQDDLLAVLRRIETLETLVKAGEGEGGGLLIRLKRVANILRIEEDRGTDVCACATNPDYFEKREEKELAAALDAVSGEMESSLAEGDFLRAVTLLASLCSPIDAFFSQVMVNVEQTPLKMNRLALLARVREMAMRIADFSKIDGQCSFSPRVG